MSPIQKQLIRRIMTFEKKIKKRSTRTTIINRKYKLLYIFQENKNSKRYRKTLSNSGNKFQT